MEINWIIIQLLKVVFQMIWLFCMCMCLYLAQLVVGKYPTRFFFVLNRPESSDLDVSELSGYFSSVGWSCTGRITSIKLDKKNLQKVTTHIDLKSQDNLKKGTISSGTCRLQSPTAYRTHKSGEQFLSKPKYLIIKQYLLLIRRWFQKKRKQNANNAPTRFEHFLSILNLLIICIHYKFL